ncbi:hypothetical protein IAQ61_009777 [Plenodomus lingam]|uniref:Predicted protein n=1 Tax=Leptosphaeria maculans (strain JN3 / isolate v23.1.3 / race Av1-4-5-6-7-8) TaxID=985895 RepID=E4ZUN6_LEPMJ|nr:predicted protein [Plenodomus lingam JN3]KAH9863499.1 hypothetical protein IAQ61_009777 [Plenodomus lingam]CBX95115.1 predicted protein [Plenodomus lingam JN3]
MANGTKMKPSSICNLKYQNTSRNLHRTPPACALLSKWRYDPVIRFRDTPPVQGDEGKPLGSGSGTQHHTASVHVCLTTNHFKLEDHQTGEQHRQPEFHAEI